MLTRSSTLFWIIIILVTIYAVFAAVVLCCSSHSEKIAQIGDSFGVINALFSALALAAIIYSIALQRQDLNLQKEELALTRKEMKAQTGLFKQQRDLEEIKLLETSLFEYINAANNLKKQFDEKTFPNQEKRIIQLIQGCTPERLLEDSAYLQKLTDFINVIRISSEELSTWSNIINLWYARVELTENKSIHSLYQKRILSFFTSTELFIIYFCRLYRKNREDEQKEKFFNIYVMDYAHHELLCKNPPENLELATRLLSAIGAENVVTLSRYDVERISAEYCYSHTR